MKTLPSFSCLSFALLVMAHFSPLAAQYNPPPPPEQANTGEPSGPPQDMSQVPPPDQGGPGPDDGSVPPPDSGPQADSDQPAPDQGDANFQTFYDNLSSQGSWIHTDNYGDVFQPNVQDPDWAPYTDGHWVYTDEGWTWLADDSEPWGWATYHYGRWANLDGYGWVWVPGYTWAPAWVSWRYGDGYCGWAPLPPDTFVGIDVEGVGAGFVFHIGGDCDTAYDIGPRYYNFLPVGYLGARNYRHHFADRNNNFVIINNTRNVTNIVVNNQRGAGRFSRVSTGGPDIATVDAQSGTRIQRVQLARSNRVGNASLNGNRLAVFAPRVSSANAGTFRPTRVAANVTNARVNNGASITQPLQVTQHVRQNAASSSQIAAAQSVHFSEGSRVATPDLRPTHVLTRPLTSFTPHQSPTARASVQSNHTANNAAVNATRPEAGFTGQNGNEVRHNDHADAQVHTQQSVATPQVQQQPVVRPQVDASTQQFEHHQHDQQVQQQAVRQQQQVQQQQVQQQPVQHQDFHPQAEVQHQTSAPVEHHEQQHQDSHPQAEHHDAPQPQQHSNNSGGNDKGKGDDKNH